MTMLYSPLSNSPRGLLRMTLAIGLLIAFSASLKAQASFSFPPGIDWNNATPAQIAQAVTDAAKNNPTAAADIAAAGVLEAGQTGRWPRAGSQDGKQSTDPDGSGGGPTMEDVAQAIADAAKAGNPDPAMAPAIDSAVAGALATLPGAGISGGSGGSGGSSGAIAPPPPGGFSGGGGGGSGGGQQPASN